VIGSSRIRGSIFIFGLFFVLHIPAGALAFPSSQTVCGNVEVVPTPSSGVYDDVIDVHINISNNQCEMFSLGFDLYYDTTMFSYQGIDTQNCLTADWSLVDANEISPGRVRVGGYSGSAPGIQSTENGCLVKVILRVICQSPSCMDGQQSVISIDSYSDELASYQPQPAQSLFTFVHYCGSISLPVDKAGTWGDLVHFPVYVANNDTQICDFTFDFLFDPSVLTFEDVAKSVSTQDWSTLTWSQIQPGTIRVQGIMGSGTCVAPMSSGILVTLKAMVECAGYTSDTSIPIRIEAYQDGIACMNPRSFDTNFVYTACPQLGDVNGDGNITPGDAQRAFEIFLGRISPTLCQLTISDANSSCPCDGEEHLPQNNCITPSDAQWIFEHYLARRVLSECSADSQCTGGSVMTQGEAWIPFDQNPEVYALPTIGNSGDRVMVPLMVNHPGGIRHFHLEMLYSQDMLEFIGVLPSPMTNTFEYLRGEENIPGIVNIEGEGEVGIAENEAGSLCVVIFQAREGAYGNAPIFLNDLGGDIFSTDVESMIYVKPDYYEGNENIMVLGEGINREGMFVVPVEVSGAFGMKAFGFDVSYSSEKMTFVKVNQTELTKDFVAVDGNDIEQNVVRIGGFSRSGIQDRNGGVLVELVFQAKESGGRAEIARVMDDLEEFTILNSRVNSENMSEKLASEYLSSNYKKE
jgi:hypothetical protein